MSPATQHNNSLTELKRPPSCNILNIVRNKANIELMQFYIINTFPNRSLTLVVIICKAFIYNLSWNILDKHYLQRGTWTRVVGTSQQTEEATNPESSNITCYLEKQN